MLRRRRRSDCKGGTARQDRCGGSARRSAAAGAGRPGNRPRRSAGSVSGHSERARRSASLPAPSWGVTDLSQGRGLAGSGGFWIATVARRCRPDASQHLLHLPHAGSSTAGGDGTTQQRKAAQRPRIGGETKGRTTGGVPAAGRLCRGPAAGRERNARADRPASLPARGRGQATSWKRDGDGRAYQGAASCPGSRSPAPCHRGGQNGHGFGEVALDQQARPAATDRPGKVQSAGALSSDHAAAVKGGRGATSKRAP